MEKDMMLIYDMVREKLGTEYENVFNHTMREDQPNDVGIYLYESSNDVEDLGGEEVYNCIKIQVQINCKQSEDDTRRASKYLSKFVRRIENEESNTEGIEIISARHIGPRSLIVGKNPYGLMVCRSLIDLKYTFVTS